MAKAKEDAELRADETPEVVTLSREEFDRLTTQASGGGVNPAPAIEEGPHLRDPDVREAKRRQLVDAGISADDDGLTDDLRAVLAEE